MNLKWTNSFTVYPEHCNHELGSGGTCIHGGTMLKEMDRTAAVAVRRLLYDTECDSSRTVGVDNLKFLYGAELGDLVVINATIVSLGLKRIEVYVECRKETTDIEGIIMATGTFWFVSFKEERPHPHNLAL